MKVQDRGVMNEMNGEQKQSTGTWWRVGATLGLLSVCILSTVRGASGAFEAASIPVADLNAQNGMVSGMLRVTGSRLLLYNGTRLESTGQSMALNFERGGSMVLCPRSQLQILTANQGSGMLLAFQTGGAQEQFPIRMDDQVLTPDWRVELASDARQGEMGVVQVVTNRHGDLCLDGSLQSGAYFRVSQLVGDASFRVSGGQSERFSDGKMETSSEGCGCDAQFAAASDTTSGSGSAVTPPSTQKSSLIATASEPPAAIASPELRLSTPPVGNAASETNAVPVAQPTDVPSLLSRKSRQRPQDVAGYVRSFVHVIFGR